MNCLQKGGLHIIEVSMRRSRGSAVHSNLFNMGTKGTGKESTSWKCLYYRSRVCEFWSPYDQLKGCMEKSPK